MDEEEIYAEMLACEQALQDKWELAKKKVEGLIHPKYFSYIEDFETYYSEGIVEIIETDEERSGYGSKQRNCRIKEKSSNLYMHTTDHIETYPAREWDGESVEYWVNQWNVGIEGDSYAGIILLPLNDGRYWKVRYSC